MSPILLKAVLFACFPVWVRVATATRNLRAPYSPGSSAVCLLSCVGVGAYRDPWYLKQCCFNGCFPVWARVTTATRDIVLSLDAPLSGVGICKFLVRTRTIYYRLRFCVTIY
jgi:hypothetical protein